MDRLSAIRISVRALKDAGRVCFLMLLPFGTSLDSWPDFKAIVSAYQDVVEKEALASAIHASN
jgi:hypothetical protein